MINIAILGAGIGREHLLALRALPDVFRVVAIVDQDTARLERIRDLDDFKALTDISQALEDPSIDVIDICLPPHLHVPVTLASLKAGKHVICEKPLATSLGEIDQIRAASVHAAKQVFPVFQYRWGPALAQLRHLIAEGLTGQVQTAALETHWSRDADYYSAPWRGTWAGERGGAVLGHAIHNHDLLTHIAGDIEALSAMTTTRVNDIETEDCAVIIFKMRSGALCTSNITLGAAGDDTRIRIVFEHLTATSSSDPYAPGAGTWTFKARDSARQQSIEDACANAQPEPIGFEGFFTEIGRTLNGHENQAVHLDHGAASVALVTAVYHAARTGTRVTLPLPNDHPLYKGWMQ